jgi:hypothetical protein
MMADKCPECGCDNSHYLHYTGGTFCLERQIKAKDARIAMLENMLNKEADLEIGVASALGWGHDGLEGMSFTQAIRGLRMAHDIERARVAELQRKLDHMEDELGEARMGDDW